MSPKLRNTLMALGIVPALLIFGPFLVPVPPLEGLQPAAAQSERLARK